MVGPLDPVASSYYLHDAGLMLRLTQPFKDYTTVVSWCAIAHADDMNGNNGAMQHVAHVHLALHGCEEVARAVLGLQIHLQRFQPSPPTPASSCLSCFASKGGWTKGGRLAFAVQKYVEASIECLFSTLGTQQQGWVDHQVLWLFTHRVFKIKRPMEILLPNPDFNPNPNPNPKKAYGDPSSVARKRGRPNGRRPKSTEDLDPCVALR